MGAMEVSWKNLDGETIVGRIEPNLWPIVKVLGIDAAAEFLLYFRGKYLHLHEGKTQARNQVVRLFGAKKAEALYRSLLEEVFCETYRVPQGKVFLCRYLRSKGLPVSEISTRVGLTDVSIRRALLSDKERRDFTAIENAKRLKNAISEAVSLGLVVRVEQPKKAVR